MLGEQTTATLESRPMGPSSAPRKFRGVVRPSAGSRTGPTVHGRQISGLRSPPTASLGFDRLHVQVVLPTRDALLPSLGRADTCRWGDGMFSGCSACHACTALQDCVCFCFSNAPLKKSRKSRPHHRRQFVRPSSRSSGAPELAVRRTWDLPGRKDRRMGERGIALTYVRYSDPRLGWV